jgi:hypothetical protein
LEWDKWFQQFFRLFSSSVSVFFFVRNCALVSIIIRCFLNNHFIILPKGFNAIFVDRIDPPLIKIYEKHNIFMFKNNRSVWETAKNERAMLKLLLLWDPLSYLPSRKQRKRCIVGIRIIKANKSSMNVFNAR